MKLSSPILNDVHALKCELAAEVLRAAGTLRLQVTGWSMLPSVWPGDTLVIESAAHDAVSEGDVVLFGRERRLFAHRVIAKRRYFADLGIMTRGDAMPAADAPVSDHELLGKVSSILRNGRRIEPSRRLHLSQRAIAAVIRRSEIAARVVVGMHGLREALLRPTPRVKAPRNREVACQN
jgi:signal peptidase I